MAGPWDLTNQNIEDTYQRILQTPDGTSFYDGTGSAVTFTATATAGGSNTQIQFNSASLLSGSSNFSFDYINNSILLTGSLDFNANTNAILNQAGRLHWNDTDGTLELGLKGGVVSSLLGQGLVTRVVNKTVPNIDLLAANYQVVVVAGAQGQRLAIKLAKADNDANSAGTLGLVAENIAKNQEGFIVTVGLLKNRDTTGALQGETWNDGDVLYLSPTTAGAITNIKPQAPQHTVIIGYVEYAHQNNGKIYVKIDNGYELDELHNVRITTASLSTGDLLMYDSGSLLWKNSKTLSGSYTLSGSLTTNDGVSVQSLTASFVSASSITGSLFGTASWTQNAVSASLVRVSASSTTNANYFLTFAPLPDGDSFRLLQTDNALYYNPSTNLLTLTNISAVTVTANNFTGTASYATQAATASFLLGSVTTASYITASGVFGPYGSNSVISSSFAVSASWAPGSSPTTPGGINKSIQFNSASIFNGSNNLLFQYDPTANDANQLTHTYNYDFSINGANSNHPASYVPNNSTSPNNQKLGLSHFQISQGSGTAATTIYRWNAVPGGTGTDLEMYGFKCDYSLLLVDTDLGSGNKVASRVGTLKAAWSWSTGNTPVLNDDFVDGDLVYNELGLVTFTLLWNDPYMELQMDTTNITAGNTIFQGIFTNFGIK